MDTILMTVGKTQSAYVRTGIEEYQKRLTRYTSFSLLELPDPRQTKLPEEARKETEGEMILDKIRPSDYVILLDERGQQYTSEQFAIQLEKLMVAGYRRLIFVVGGAFGFSQKVYDRANALISLSRMTFNHEMVRLFFTEQIYRAHTILRGEPYHHGDSLLAKR